MSYSERLQVKVSQLEMEVEYHEKQTRIARAALRVAVDLKELYRREVGLLTQVGIDLVNERDQLRAELEAAQTADCAAARC